MALALKKKPAEGKTPDQPKPAKSKAKGGKGKKGAVEAAAPKLSKKQQAELDKPFVATLPGVNLLSPEVQEVVEQHRLIRLFIGLAVGIVVAIVAAFLAQQGLITVAQHKLDDEQAKSSALAVEQSKLAPVKTFYAQIDANKATIQTTMAKEVLTSEVLVELNRLTPAGLSIGNTSITLDAGGTATTAPADTASTGSSCPSQDPYNSAGVSAGCVTVDGTASSRAVVGDWLDKVEKSDMFTVAFIPATTTGGETGGVTFSATIGLSDSVYKNRYADPDFLKAGTK